MAIVELIKIMIMSVNIESLVEQGVNVKIEITAADLKMFGEVFRLGGGYEKWAHHLLQCAHFLSVY